MAKYILGLDIGTNSIGWTLLNNNEIIDGGVIIFPIGTNVDKNGIEATKNMERRKYRGASRNHFRYKLRRRNLKKLLDKIGMLPDFSKTYKIKEKYQASELYALRTEALYKPIPPEEIGRLFLLINKHRGFKSNSKILSNENKEDGTVKEAIGQLQKFMDNNNARTIGEYFHKMYIKASSLHNEGNWHNIDEPFDERAETDGIFVHKNNRGIRRENGRYVGRDMYENEFDLIWEEQKKQYPQLTGSKEEYDQIRQLPVPVKREQLKVFKETAYWRLKYQTIFYQRPLRSQKKYIGKCQFIKNKRTAPASSLSFQEFRIWKQLADIKYTDKENDIYGQSLPNDLKQRIFDYLQIHPKLNLREGGKKKDGSKNTDIMDVLGFTNKRNFDFNFDNDEDDKTFEGNKTLYAIYTACGEEIYNGLKASNKLEKLWHILYMAKDDEWLKDTLTSKWQFNDDTATRLVEMGLEDGYASYSSKVIEKTLPYLRDGKDEYDSLILAGFIKSPDEVQEEIVLNKKIKQLVNNELRNPVVEKAVCETIRLVNTILQTKGIDQDNFIIRIESTRELKKPKKERENIRRGNSDTDKRREEYARFLNEKRKNGDLLFARDIQKYDSIIHKFELWLELGADKNDTSFKDFEKIVQKKDREKHSLWLESNRICPYSGRIIGLSKLFSSEIEIEHIIPYSRCLDDSFINKTITFTEINKEKGNQTAFEYLQSKGKNAFKDFKERIKIFSKEKQESRFLKEKVEVGFTNEQLTNTSYIARYVRKKLHEVCKDVQFTNGAATAELRKNDWRLNNLLDKIRYEEEKGIDIDQYLREFSLYKKDFQTYRKKKANSTDIQPMNWNNLTQDITANYEAETRNPIYEWWLEIQKFDAFRGLKGKKDRSDHRHHLLDAIIIAMCSPKIIQELSTFNQLREKQGISMYDEKGELTRERINCPLKYEQIKSAIKDVLIYHRADQKLITTKTNRIQRKKNHEGDVRVIKQKTIAPRGSLHADNYFGKLKNPLKQGFDKKDVYVKRIPIEPEKFKDISALDKVVDRNVREILKRRLIKYGEKGDKAFSEEALLSDPLYLYSVVKYPDGLPDNPSSKLNKPLPIIKKIRVVNKNSRNLIQLAAKDENREIVNHNRYAETDGNYVMAIYESREKDKKGKVKVRRDFEIVSFFKAVEKRRLGLQMFSDEKMQKDGTYLPLMSNCPYLKQDDFVVMYENDENEIDWKNNNDLKRRLYKISEIGRQVNTDGGEFGVIKLIRHNSQKTTKDKYITEGSFIKILHSGIKCIKIAINNLGEITKHRE